MCTVYRQTDHKLTRMCTTCEPELSTKMGRDFVSPLLMVPKSSSSRERNSPGLSETSTSTGRMSEGCWAWSVWIRMKEVKLVATPPKKLALAMALVS